jgi:acetyl-CoA carboxylase carboxyl transferase subunit alpha
MRTYLDFEKPVADLQGKVQELKSLGANGDAIAVDEEISRMEARANQTLTEIYAKLTPWQKTQVARHPDRPHVVDYLKGLIDEFTPLAGDRKFGDDQAMVAGLGRFRGRPVAVLGQEKGSDTEGRLRHNFGMPRPEGYRKAMRLMHMAARFHLPLVTFIDTPGAYPGVGAEERGQAEAIARNLQVLARLPTPIVCTIIGEGGSGGALAIGVGDRVNMLEYSTYSVISPEGCASILWKDAANAEEAATALGITSTSLKGLGLIDEVIEEPLGGAHKEPDLVAKRIADCLEKQLDELAALTTDDLLERRYQRLLSYGEFQD